MTGAPGDDATPEPDDLATAFDEVAAGGADPTVFARLARAVGASSRSAGIRAVASGRWLASTFVDLAPRIKVRDLETLQNQHGGLQGADLADALVKSASRASAAVGAAAGALISIEHFAPPAWVTMPAELVAETLAIAVIELKLVAELHEVFGRPVRGTASERTVALVQAWAERRGVTPAALARRGGLGEALGRSTRHELVRLARRRLMGRLGRNLSTLAPLLAGAAAAAEVNRRATRAVGDAVIRDLGLTSPGGAPL